MLWRACAVPVHFARLLSQSKPRVTAASGFCSVITSALDEFKYLCKQGLSLHSFGIYNFLGQLSQKKSTVSLFFEEEEEKVKCVMHVTKVQLLHLREGSYLLLQLWHLHLVPSQMCRHTCIPQNHLPVVY